MKIYMFRLKFHWSLFPGVQLNYSRIGWDNGLVSTRRQTITEPMLTQFTDGYMWHWREMRFITPTDIPGSPFYRQGLSDISTNSSNHLNGSMWDIIIHHDLTSDLVWINGLIHGERLCMVCDKRADEYCVIYATWNAMLIPDLQMSSSDWTTGIVISVMATGLHVITFTSQWPRWRLKSPASRLFTQSFIQAQIKENIKAPRHWPLCGEFTGDRWIPRTKGQWRGKCFHLMTSSCTMSLTTFCNHVVSLDFTQILQGCFTLKPNYMWSSLK